MDSCRGLHWAEVVLGLFSMLGPALFSSLRVYALSGQHRVLTGLTLGLVLMPFFINVSTDYQSHPVNLDPPYNCYLDSTTSPSVALATDAETVTFLSRAASTLADFIAYRSDMANHGMLATLNILHIVLTALSFKLPSGSESYVINFIDPIGSILVCRFLLSLQEAQQNTRPSSGTTPSFVAPDFVGSPSFAAPLAGFRRPWNSDLDFAWDTASELERRGSDSTAVSASEPEKNGSVSSMEDFMSKTPVSI
ncbi:hypothetical protein C8T65DRAFT_687066 [Cerioporus squamosus]|nr:hypothetical protein C8T65DRAFT_687066 [Cerioporus squamosus]